MKILDENQLVATEHCTYCPRLCRSACPVETASGREALTPKMKMQVARELVTQRVPLEADTAAALWGCSDCGACESMCLHKNPVGETLYDARAYAQDVGIAPAPVVARAQAFTKYHNSLGLPLAPRQRQVGSGARDAQVALLLGCEALADERLDLRALFTRLQNLGEKIALPYLHVDGVPQGICCGRSLREAGGREAWAQHAARVADALSSHEEWWIFDGACSREFETIAERAASKPRVRSLFDVLVDAKLAPVRRVPSLTLQLGCATNHRPALREAVIQLAQRVTDDLRIPDDNLPFAGCCGGRGGITDVYPDVAADMGRGRSQELQGLGADHVAYVAESCAPQLPQAVHLLSFYA